MSALSAKEQRNVRTALRFVRSRTGGWDAAGKVLHTNGDNLSKIAKGQRSTTVTLAFHIARFASVGVDDVLSGAFPSPRACPHCGHPPDDFRDEDTHPGDAPTGDGGGLRVVR